mmetsp:Transcript_23773/g.53658  ORF Transcript_23773/g.53658 Transcript_23773/m.53658 type:complete len:293 (+) Transcript_23773:273-1151(+)
MSAIPRIRRVRRRLLMKVLKPRTRHLSAQAATAAGTMATAARWRLIQRNGSSFLLSKHQPPLNSRQVEKVSTSLPRPRSRQQRARAGQNLQQLQMGQRTAAPKVMQGMWRKPRLSTWVPATIRTTMRSTARKSARANGPPSPQRRVLLKAQSHLHSPKTTTETIMEASRKSLGKPPSRLVTSGARARRTKKRRATPMQRSCSSFPVWRSFRKTRRIDRSARRSSLRVKRTAPRLKMSSHSGNRICWLRRRPSKKSLQRRSPKSKNASKTFTRSSRRMWKSGTSKWLSTGTRV